MVSILPRKSNLNAAVAISEVVRTSLGPHARNKLLVDDTGHVTSSNDGHTVLKGLPVEHPIGELIVQLSSGQDDAIGDGTTSVVVVFGALCSKALYLIDKGLHPSVLIDGYQKACEFALAQLAPISELQHSHTKSKQTSQHETKETEHESSSEAQNKQQLNANEELLQYLANTALHSKVAEQDRALLTRVCINAIQLAKKHPQHIGTAHNISLQAIPGGSLDQSRLLHGIVLTGKGFIHPDMPKQVSGANKKNVAVLSCSLDLPRPKTQFSLHAQTQESQEVMRSLTQIYARDTLAILMHLGVGVVFCQWGVDPYLADLMAKNGIVAVKWIAGNDLERIAITVGALICPYLPTLTPTMLGSTPRIAENEQTKHLEIEGTAATIIVRGGETVAESAIISIHDALFVLENAFSDPRTVAGGGATEIEVYTRVMEFANKESSRDRYIITAWADALLSIPTTLAENASFFAPDIVSELIASHRKGMPTLGVGASDGAKDMAEEGIWELLKMKYSIISLATECACHVIKIDECILLPKEAST